MTLRNVGKLTYYEFENRVSWNIGIIYILWSQEKIGTNENMLKIKLIYYLLRQFELPDKLYCTLNEVIMTLYETH